MVLLCSCSMIDVLRNFQGIEEFYSLTSRLDVRLEMDFLDLTLLAITAGYKFHSKNMLAMVVQVHGTLLNKTVSTGDNLWGLRWIQGIYCHTCLCMLKSGLKIWVHGHL